MSKKIIAIVSFILLTGLLIYTAGCLSETPEDTTSGETAETTETAENGGDSPIKKVDFKNFEYPLKKVEGEKEDKTLALKDGKLEKTEKSAGATVGEIQYAELTGDQMDEAIVNLAVEGEKEKTNLVYVYTLENEKPKLLWSFDAGNLKAISSEKGVLLVEIFGDAKFNKGSFEITAAKEEDKKKYTKTGLKWNGKEFVVEGEPEIKEVDAQT